LKKEIILISLIIYDSNRKNNELNNYGVYLCLNYFKQRSDTIQINQRYLS
jgi:hypothetical protein